jgi:hypothetical protein
MEAWALTMESGFLIGATLIGSFATAFVLQKAALEAVLRAINPERRARD